MKIGIIGGGQLGQMLALAGIPLGMEFVFLDPAPGACASRAGCQMQAGYEDRAALEALAAKVDLVTFEFENVPAETVSLLGQHVPVYPNAEALRVARDRWFEKSLFRTLDIPTPAFANIQSQDDLEQAVGHIGLPAVLKTRTLGYDGKGQRVLPGNQDVAGAFEALGGVPCILEEFVAFRGEVSLVAVRDRKGSLVFYPLSRNVHREGILRLSTATREHPLQKQAQGYVSRIMEKLDYVGVLAFEFFETGSGLKANEIAPRVHNSGHWTIEGAATSQFENHLRAIAGLPLGEAHLIRDSAMVNFIGSMPAPAQLLDIPECHIHDYGKAFRSRRKVGHATLCANTGTVLVERVERLQALLTEDQSAGN